MTAETKYGGTVTDTETDRQTDRQRVSAITYLHMVLQYTRPAERPVTHSTLVWSDAGVNTSVDLEVTGRRKPLATDFTFERFTTAVGQHVIT